jgi:hypothetical protein
MKVSTREGGGGESQRTLVIGGIGPYNKRAQKTGCDSIGRAGSSLACSSSSLLSQLLETWIGGGFMRVVGESDEVYVTILRWWPTVCICLRRQGCACDGRV